MEFSELIPRLVQANDRGLLVPFTGSGMSYDACVNWQKLIENLDRQADKEPSAHWSPEARPTESELVREAFNAVRRLRRRCSLKEFAEEVRRALREKHGIIPRQTTALARIDWPLVITTNYDDIFCRAYLSEQSGQRDRKSAAIDVIEVFGRGVQDCERVLASLSFPTHPILWAIQGFLWTNELLGLIEEPQAAAPEIKNLWSTRRERLLAQWESLAEELVIGHEEYRHVTHRIPHFRRAFAEVYRHRSLLFLGAGLEDRYLLDLFGEVLEMGGANPTMHYALMPAGKVDPEFLLARFNILVAEYPEARHEDVEGALTELKEALRKPRAKTIRWVHALTRESEGVHSSTLEIVYGALTPPSDKGECLAVSIGLSDGGARVSERVTDVILEAGANPKAPKWVGDYLAQFRGSEQVFGIAARSGTGQGTSADRRDIRIIGTAFRSFLAVVGSKFERASVQLLAAGRRRVFPAVFSLIEMVRAYGSWMRNDSGASRKLSRLDIHLDHPDHVAMLSMLSTGQLDVDEILNCWDIRLIVDIEGERQILHQKPTLPLKDLALRFSVPVDSKWRVEVIPNPERHYIPQTTSELAGYTLEQLGVVSGSIVRLSRGF